MFMANIIAVFFLPITLIGLACVYLAVLFVVSCFDYLREGRKHQRRSRCAERMLAAHLPKTV